MKTKQNNNSAAVIIAAFLVLSASLSLLYLLAAGPGSAAGGYVAEIYQEGRLLYSLPLSDISESRTLIIESAEGGINEIEIRPGSIGIISADCPDKLCVRQGFIADAKLPITCLPNRLVILLRPAPDTTDHDPVTPDIFTY